jgi:hypothetical protein
MLHFGFLHTVKELAGVGRETFHVTPKSPVHIVLSLLATSSALTLLSLKTRDVILRLFKSASSFASLTAFSSASAFNLASSAT